MQSDVIGVMQSDDIPDDFCQIINTFNDIGCRILPSTIPIWHKPKPRIWTEQMSTSFKGRDMKKEQQGFTLIELMIVVAIIGILAAIAIPAYQDYTIRAQISEGLTLAGGAKTALSEYYFDRGAWPTDNDEAGLADKHDIIGKYTEHVEVEDNVIEIKFGYDAHATIMDEKIELTAVNNAGSISWSCASAGTIQAKHLPAACR